MDKKIAVIDRIENGIAVLIPEDGSDAITVYIPEGFFEGEAVVIEEGIIRHASDEEKPKRNNKEKLKKLFNKNK